MGIEINHKKRHDIADPNDHKGDIYDALLGAAIALTSGNVVVDTATMIATIAAAIGDLIDKGEVDAATTAALPANTRTGDVLKGDAVGAFPTIDGVAAALNNTYLVKNEGGVASHINNGLYTLTVVGDGATEFELTRNDNLANGDPATGAFIHIQQGTANLDSTFRCINNTGTDIVNTDALEWRYWGQTIDHQYLKNLLWSAAGHTIDTDIDMNGHDIIGYSGSDYGIMIRNPTSGKLSTLSYKHISYGRTPTATADDYVELCRLEARNVWIKGVLSSDEVGHIGMNVYDFTINRDSTSGLWMLVRPTKSTFDDLKLMVMTDGTYIYLRALSTVAYAWAANAAKFAMLLSPATITDQNSTGAQSPIPLSYYESLDTITDLAAYTDEPTGMIDASQYTLSFNDGILALVMTLTGTYFDYFIKGQRYVIRATTTKVIGDVEGLHYIYFDAAGIIQETTTWTDLLITDYTLIATVYWDATAKKHIYLGEEGHGITMDGATHLILHHVFGARYQSGCAVTPDTTEGGVNESEIEAGIALGIIWDEDIKHDLAAHVLTNNISKWYRTAAGLWREDATDSHIALDDGANLYYDQTGVGLTVVPNTNYVLAHIFATNDAAREFVVVIGQDVYTTKPAAYVGAETEMQSLQLNGLPAIEFVAIATVILKCDTAAAYDGYAVTTGAGGDYIDWRETPITNGNGISSPTASQITIADIAGLFTAINVEGALAEIIERYDANTIIKADSDNTPIALAVPVQTLIGRITAGVIDALTPTEVRTLINVEDGADVTDEVNIASSIIGVAEKATPVNADTIPIIDSAAASALKELTWANLKATLMTYFTTIKATFAGVDSTDDITLTDPGNNTDSHLFLATANNGSVLQTGGFMVRYGAAPYMAMLAPVAGGGYELVMDFRKTDFSPQTTATTDLGSGTKKYKDGHFSGDIAVDGTVDGRDVATDGTKLDAIEALADVTDEVNIASSIVGVADKATPVNADTIPIIDSAAASVLKELTWANLKTTLWATAGTLYAAITHKDTHDPEDGSDPLDCAAPGSIDENANAEGSSHSFARADHNHQHLATLHENGGGAEINVIDLSGLLADDQHVLDAEVQAISINNVVEDTTPQLGGDLDLNTKYITMDDGGIKITGQDTSAAGTAGDLMYLSAADTWALADADLSATSGPVMLGICLVDHATTGEILVFGPYTTAALTAANIYYVSTTAGDWTTTAPSVNPDIVRIIGYALNTTTLFFDPDSTYIEVAA